MSLTRAFISPKCTAALSVALILAMAYAVSWTSRGDAANVSTKRWGKDYLPNLTVVDQDGKSYRFFDDLIDGKIVAINFIYTTCTDICPLTTARLAVVQEKLGDAVGRDIFMYSITVDPEHDDPAALKRHADAFGVKPGWKFLTGKPEDIRLIRTKLGERSRVISEHRHEIMLGNAATGEWSRDSAFGDLDNLAINIKSMDPKWRDQVHEIPRDAAIPAALEVTDRPGQALFIKACAACHTVGKGVRIGPDLNGVATRRSRDWLSRFITRPDKMIAENDPDAVALAAKFPGVRMPNLQVTDTDARDLIAYLEAETYAANADPSAAAEHQKQHDHGDTHEHEHEHDHGAHDHKHP